jgi:hypothetical protein
MSMQVVRCVAKVTTVLVMVYRGSVLLVHMVLKLDCKQHSVVVYVHLDTTVRWLPLTVPPAEQVHTTTSATNTMCRMLHIYSSKMTDSNYLLMLLVLDAIRLEVCISLRSKRYSCRAQCLILHACHLQAVTTLSTLC